MQVGAVSYQPFVYRANAISPKSLNKISAIGDDVTSSKLDVSGLVSDDAKKQENVNPLKPGQSLDFSGILQMQMQMGRVNEARIMQKATENPKELASLAVGQIDNSLSAGQIQNQQQQANPAEALGL